MSMGLLKKIYNKLIINESVNVDSITDAIRDKYQVVINYEGDPSHGIAPGKRVIEVYAYGLTKAGNPCFRAYQPYGDTVTETPEWKLFRVDRVTSWEPTHKKILRPAPKFNPNGDRSMSQVFTIANFAQSDVQTKGVIEPQKYNPIGKVDNIDKILKDRDKDKANRRRDNRAISRFRSSAERDDIESQIDEPAENVLNVNLDNTKIPEPKIDGVDDIEDGNIEYDDIDDVNIDNIFKTPGDEQLEKMKDLSRRMDNAPKIDLSKFN